MSVRVVDHPVAQQALLELRRAATDTATFRRLAFRLGLLLAADATRDLPTREDTVDSPLEPAVGRRLDADIVVVPVLRAGLALVDPILTLVPSARVGHVGLARDERTAVASRYFAKLPPIDAESTVLVADPMLATGGSAIAALGLAAAAGAGRLRLLTVVAAPEGLRAVAEAWPDVTVFTAAVDRGLNAAKFILPGLGDFGDRLYGT